MWIAKRWKWRHDRRPCAWLSRARQQRMNADLSDPAGPPWTDRCGGVAEYPGRHQKTFESVRGPQHWQRAYYPCAPCGSGFGPRDHALRWELFWLTPGVLRMTGSTAALVSLEESSGLLPERAGVEGAQQVERAAEALGTERADEERGKEGPSSPDHVPWGWTAAECPCVRRKSPAARANRRMAPRRPARPRRSLCGPPNPETRTH